LTPAEQIALWADKLRDLSAQGLHFAEDIYDRERYQAVQEVALAMLAMASGQSLEALEPLRATVFSHFTPLIGGDAAVIDGQGRILLIQRADNGNWAMPGGALDVGETPAEGVLREVLEETGLPCEPVALVGIFDVRPSGVTGLHHLYLITFLCKPVDGAEPAPPSHANEVLDIGWYRQDELPDNLYFTAQMRIDEAFRVWRDGGPAFFDYPG
jgi:8-oxo-dGTP pyrophosphatase MutT (NUDIX family)